MQWFDHFACCFPPSKTSPLPPNCGGRNSILVLMKSNCSSLSVATNRLIKVNTFIHCYRQKILLSATDREDTACDWGPVGQGGGAPDSCRGSKCGLGVQGDDINHCAASYRQSCSCNFPLQDLDIFRFWSKMSLGFWRNPYFPKFSSFVMMRPCAKSCWLL